MKNPFSAYYYVKENIGRSLLVGCMFFLTTMLLLGGNYIQSNYYYWDGICDYTESVTDISGLPTDENYEEYAAVIEELMADPELIVMLNSGFGAGAPNWKCTLGFTMGNYAARYNTAEDLRTAFRILGYKGDFSRVHDGSVIMSEALAKNKGFELGDTLGPEDGLHGEFTLDALIENDTFCVFYVESEENNLIRAHVLSETLESAAVRERVSRVIGDRKVKVNTSIRGDVDSNLGPINLIFYVSLFLLSFVLAVSVNSVIAGHYAKRMYEFGIYRALGRTKGEIRRKCSAEIALTDAIATITGVAAIEIYTFLMNELYYIPHGQYLPYFSSLGLIGLVIANALVLVPVVLLRGRAMCRADVTEF
ncbi:MAG: ABC transporter permease [Lachnospiraceae bacterium]|nr:ABC transporter permease [Lachnospiraceae bacterium]